MNLFTDVLLFSFGTVNDWMLTIYLTMATTDRVYKKTQEYVAQFARFNTTDSAQAARQLSTLMTPATARELASFHLAAYPSKFDAV